MMTTPPAPAPARTPSPALRPTVRRTLRLAGLRAGFRVLERLAPDLAGHWAIRLWCTLPSTPGRRRDERPRPGATTTLPLYGERSVVVETWGDGPPVYLMHGWGGWRGQLGAFVDPLVAAGQRVVAIDAPGHGDAAPGAHGPGRADPGELLEALRAVVAAYGRPAGIVGHSLGGLTAGMAALDGLDAERLVLIAPGAEATAQFAAFVRTVGAGHRTRARAVALAERIARRPFADFDLIGRAPGAVVPPVLVIHDVADKEVPYDVGARLAEVWSDAELLTTDGLGHQRILRDPTVVAAVVDYLARPTGTAAATAGDRGTLGAGAVPSPA